MSDDMNFKEDTLLNICKHDEGLEKFREELIKVDSKHDKFIIAKQIEKSLSEYPKYQQEAYKYLSGLSNLDVYTTVNCATTIFEYNISFCEHDMRFIIEPIKNQMENVGANIGLNISAKENLSSLVIIEDIKIQNSSYLNICDLSDKNVAFKRLSITNINLIPRKKGDYFNIEKFLYEEHYRILSKTEKRKIDYLEIVGSFNISFEKDIENNYLFKGINGASIAFSKFGGALVFRECLLSKLEWNNCKFKELPEFDEKTSIKHSVDIDKKTFEN